ncbi:hypothetical protein [Bacillus sp. FJAT-50079]|uniref:hypothetical protein n=1 Tax=Bacillus sp. FJAT-50079 TaxID=2833577 RepID=UPI001BC9659D|nr:hypothetical protein [Bacillus sp. FJAT-50079]MBS4210074.1 hypothetical protein [Bacillus sp. FJAT-50079]
MIKKIMICAIGIMMLTGCNAGSSKNGQGDQPDKTENLSHLQEDGVSDQSKESANPQALTQEEVIQETEKQLKTGMPVKLPKTIVVSDGKYLTAKTSSDSDQYVVMFFETDQPVPINNDELENMKVNIATLKGTKYESEEKAAEQVNYENHAEVGGQKIDLGNGITGYAEGAAGSQYIGWNEGRWSIVVRGQTEQGEHVADEAKKVVQYLEEHTLPVPHEHGAAMLDVTENNEEHVQRIVWQEGEIVYEIEAVRSALEALDLAVATAGNP